MNVNAFHIADNGDTEAVPELSKCHPKPCPELVSWVVSESHNPLILLDAEPILSQAQHKVQYDKTWYFINFWTASHIPFLLGMADSG